VRRFGILPLALLLAIGLHVDWHLARPLHHRLSLAWQQHWIFAAAIFAAVAMLVALRWPPPARWRAAGWVLAVGLIAAHFVEPVLTLVFFERRVAYEVEPERWTIFFESLAAGLPAYAVTLWCVGRRRSDLRVT
jgi:hypothetical protein